MQQVVLNGVDHHRSKQLLSSCFEALSKKLLVPYIRYWIEKGEEASNDGYQDWVDNFIDDPTYMFLYHVTFTYLLGFHLYNEATRKNHSLRMMAARVQCSKLFFSFNHGKYQELLSRDLHQRVQMLETLINYITSHESFSVSGEKNRGEGADFVHENSNKTTKSFLAPGIPTAETWRRVCRKATDLRKLKENALGNTKKSSKQYKKFDNEVTMMRREIRSCQFIKMSPHYSSDIIAVDGQKLDAELCDFRYNGNLNHENYKKQLKASGRFGCEIMKPIFITPKEREMNTIKLKQKEKAILSKKLKKY